MFGKKKNAPPDTVGKGKVFSGLFPGYAAIEEREAGMVDLPGSAGSYFGIMANEHTDLCGNTSNHAAIAAEEYDGVAHILPKARAARYKIFDAMIEDPTIRCALDMHLTMALSAKSDTGEVVFIEPNGDAEASVVEDLRTTLLPFIRRELHEWAYNAALYGAHYVRVYGASGKGITNIRSDFYTHAQHVKKFEKGGRLAGFTCTYQGANAHRQGQIRLLPPWTLVGFEIPHWRVRADEEPTHYGPNVVDLAQDICDKEPLVESQEYGTSLIETAYAPWLNLLEALASLNMSRQNAARLERLIGVNTGRLDVHVAAGYLDKIARQLESLSRDRNRQSLLRGNVVTVSNHLVPVMGDKGSMEINTVQGTPDITAIEDVMFHVKRLGSALGVDPSLLGFGDLMSGALGDGGFFRMSVTASSKAGLLRQSVYNGIMRLCEIHLAYKYGKIFLPDQRPWRLTFNSVNTAMEREEQENREARANAATTLASIISLVDQNYDVTERRALMNYVFVEQLKGKEEDFEKIWPKGKKPEQGQEEDGEE